jgi:uncharacterized damage-inducible protein DinB
MSPSIIFMNPEISLSTRRLFLRQAGFLSAGFPALGLFTRNEVESNDAEENINIIGPKAGYSPQIGTLVSMLTWMRATVLRSVQKLDKADLDFLFDANSNTIGALLMHLAATEAFYQLNTFQEFSGDKLPDEFEKKWMGANDLGEVARKQIRGHDLKYYVDIMTETREATLAEFKKRDDAWLMKVDPQFFGGQPTNNYCKWFHVCEHESNHNGQIKWYVKRIPGKKAAGE